MSTDSATMVLVGDAHLEPGEILRVRSLEASGAKVVAWQHTTIVQDRFPSPNVAKCLDNAAIGHVTLADALGPDEDFDVDEAVIAWFKNFGRDRFRDRFRSGPLVLWWWAELYLYHETPLRLAVRDIEALSRLVAAAKPTRLVVVRPVRALEAAARSMVADVDVLGDPVAGPMSRWRTSRLHVADLLKMLGTGVKSVVRRPPPARRKNGTNVFFLTHGSMWRGDREMYFDEILPRVATRASTTVVAFGPPVPFNNRGARTALRDLLELGEDELPYQPIRRYLSLSMSLRLARAFSECRRMWREFAASAEIAHQNVPLGPEALACFRDTFYRQLPWALRAYHEVDRVLDVERPDVLVLYAESSGLGRAAVTAARVRGIPSFAVQHGIMYPQYYSHEHAPFELEREDEGEAVPVPTKTAVFGSAARDLLLRRGHYPADRIVITGSPKFDALVRASQGFDADATRQTLGVPHAHRFLVLATRWTAVGPVFSELVDAVESIPELSLYVKPHQAESTEPYDFVLERRRPARTRVLSASTNLLELLFASDGLVTVDSFASSEALVLGRPVLVVNLPSNLGALVERGVALGVRRGDPIEAALRALLDDDAVAGELERKRKDYIQEFAFGADGGATERIVNAILAMTSDGK